MQESIYKKTTGKVNPQGSCKYIIHFSIQLFRLLFRVNAFFKQTCIAHSILFRKYLKNLPGM